MNRRNIYCTILVLLNLVSLYFIIELVSYDEITAYVLEDKIKSANPRTLGGLLFFTTLCNLYFMAFSIMEKTFEEKYKADAKQIKYETKKK